MIDASVRAKYTPTIGIECHVQLNTRTKLFAAVANDARDAEPNTLISHICLGMPGALPVLNKKVLEHSIKVAYAFGVRPQEYSFFERKHYFYPDLPKGYQITQLTHPIIKGGAVTIEVNGEDKSVQINRVQIEEDAGKSTHPAGKDYSLVDLNRAGTPLLEIVSEPVMHSAAEAKAYARELWLVMRYCRVSDADMYHGNMRFDVNVSVSQDPQVFGTRSETKNLNSFKSVEKAVDYEINRQIELLEKGQPIVQETRGWDDAKQKTISQRGKEEAHDYRYFPEPDVPPIELTDNDITAAQKDMPKLPHEWRAALVSLGLEKSHIEILLEAELDSSEISYMELLKQVINDKNYAKKLADWLVNVEIPLRRSSETVNSEYSDNERLAVYGAVHQMAQADMLSSTNAKALITTLLRGGARPDNIQKYAEEQGLVQLSDSASIDKIVTEVLAENAAAAEDVRNGEMKAIGFLVGQVMKKSQGKANPGVTQELIKKQLGV